MWTCSSRRSISIASGTYLPASGTSACPSSWGSTRSPGTRTPRRGRRPAMAHAAGLMIDVHRTLTGSEAPPQAGWDAVWPRRTWIELDGHRLPSPDQETLALHIALHAARHGAGTPHPMEDLSKAIDRWPPEVWRGADRLAVEAAGDRGVCRGAASAATGLRTGPRPRAPADRRAGMGDRPPHRAPTRNAAFPSLRGAATLRERASVLRRGLLPGRTWVAKQYPWADDHGVRLVGGYVAHLARTPVWAARAWRFGRRSRRR